MGLMFVIVSVFLAVGFLAVFATLAVQAASGIAEWSRNNALTVQESPARVLAKRTEMRGGGPRHGHGRGRVRTYYYVAFDLRSGERQEFEVPGPEYGVLVEGDEGTLTHQGTRYHGFRRPGAKGIDRDF
ncbi:DUF2500 domain-containing protein [Planctomyces sp. SH-PL62]|uniref:DUF2500 domain-containing protein n=1 Tax=Planctomyces sp. SH-PL62 TaxID=1636152 RepID=UPI00078BB5EB|nr:DUF2500 domain-containing protein [Planctomyces sp. SH-PL62]AMV37893.1 hypothetical protein VT85_10675 [Planctomyces sp. SH-PL62]